MESFAYADSYDGESARYQGLHHGARGLLSESDTGLLVRSDVAVRQLKKEVNGGGPINGGPAGDINGDPRGPDIDPHGGDPPSKDPSVQPRRYHGSVQLDPTRVGRDAGQIAAEVIAHLSGLMGAKVRLTLEIEADIPGRYTRKRSAHSYRKQPEPKIRGQRLRKRITGTKARWSERQLRPFDAATF